MPFILHRVVGSRTVLQTVDGDLLRIGRGAGADLRFEDTAVALEHAVLRREGSDYWLQDLGSITGTYVNGEPVGTAMLRDGDEVGVGGFVLKVRRSDSEDPLFLHIRAAAAEPRPGATPVVAREVDYAGAFRLRRGLLNKGFLGVSITALALVGVLAVPALRRLEAFRPGALTSVHADRIDQRGGAACASCHLPWRGAADDRCQECHGPGKVDPAPAHHVAVLPAGLREATPCTACHLEHLGREGLMPATDDRCLACHRELNLAPGAAATFAGRVTSFPGGHPPFALTLPGPGGGLRRVRLDDPGARRSDRTAIKLNHKKHMEPGLLSPKAAKGRETLTCESCHALAPDDDATAGAGPDLAPIEFEPHCARCHALTFDDRYPGKTAPHAPPQDVAAFLFRTYLEEGMTVGPVRGDLLRFLVQGGRGRGERERRASEEVRRAELRLYQNACIKCHVMDLDAAPRPTVQPPVIPSRWLPHSRFSHRAHTLPGLTCAHCHPAALTSTETADVLLPDLDACAPCHGGSPSAPAEAGFRVTPGPTSCRTCHAYHSGPRAPPPAAEGKALRAASLPVRGTP